MNYCNSYSYMYIMYNASYITIDILVSYEYTPCIDHVHVVLQTCVAAVLLSTLLRDD